MKQRLYVYAYAWNKESLSFTTQEINDSNHVFLKAFEVELPADIIPSDEVFERLSHENRIKCAENTVHELNEKLSKALGALKELQAIGHKP